MGGEKRRSSLFDVWVMLAIARATQINIVRAIARTQSIEYGN